MDKYTARKKHNTPITLDIRSSLNPSPLLFLFLPVFVLFFAICKSGIEINNYSANIAVYFILKKFINYFLLEYTDIYMIKYFNM